MKAGCVQWALYGSGDGPHGRSDGDFLLHQIVRSDLSTERQEDPEAGGAAAGGMEAAEADAALVFLNNPLADPQAKAGTLRGLRGKERLKEPLGVLATNACALRGEAAFERSVDVYRRAPLLVAMVEAGAVAVTRLRLNLSAPRPQTAARHGSRK